MARFETVREAFDGLKEQLTTVYEQREAHQIASIVFEDIFHIKGAATSPLPWTISQDSRLSEATRRLLLSEPVQYVTGVSFFYGLRMQVNSSVLIPRPETEELVAWILEDHRKGGPVTVTDLGTGSGCIALAIKKKRSEWKVTATDVSAPALQTAKDNADNLGLEVTFVHADMLDSGTWDLIPESDIIVSNPPYIPYQEKRIMSRQVYDFEPETALFVPDDRPLLYYDAIASLAKNRLKAGGMLYLEINEFLGQSTADLLLSHGYSQPVIKKDLSGKDRMIRASWYSGT